MSGWWTAHFFYSAFRILPQSHRKHWMGFINSPLYRQVEPLRGLAPQPDLRWFTSWSRKM